MGSGLGKLLAQAALGYNVGRAVGIELGPQRHAAATFGKERLISLIQSLDAELDPLRPQRAVTSGLNNINSMKKRMAVGGSAAVLLKTKKAIVSSCMRVLTPPALVQKKAYEVALVGKNPARWTVLLNTPTTPLQLQSSLSLPISLPVML